jgi:Flp pilus assembly pilin Flp
MFFTNKWANLAVIVAVVLVITMVVVSSTKVVDKDGKATGNKLKAFGKDETKAAA